MKVLILHQHFNTPEEGGAVRSYYLAKALAERGIAVTVITGYGGSRYEVRHIEGIEVHYLPIGYNNRFGFYKRSLSFMRYVQGALRIATGLRYSRMLCYICTAYRGARCSLAKDEASPSVYIRGGRSMARCPIQLGFIRNYFLKSALYSLERTIYRQAQSVVALSPMIRDAIDRKVPGKRIDLIPNMSVYTAFYKPEAKDAALEQKFGVPGKFVVSYIGAVGFANGLDYYLECARACQKAGAPIQFLVCGDGAMRAHLKAMAQKLALHNLTFYRLPESQWRARD